MIMVNSLFTPAGDVKVAVKPETLELRNGSDAVFDLRLEAGEGIHVNTRPAITVESQTKGVELSIKELPKSGDYLDLGRPIEVQCKASGLTQGAHRVDFIVGFTYCSDNEGWCRLGRDSSFIEIEVSK